MQSYYDQTVPCLKYISIKWKMDKDGHNGRGCNKTKWMGSPQITTNKFR